jgi:DNA-binding NarL/FixJ family response regulator
MAQTRIFLADDQLLVRAGIRALLETAPEYVIVGESADGQGAVAGVGRLMPDAVILDIAMPVLNGIEVARRIHALDSTIKILILSGLDGQEVVEQALYAGAQGYLLKDFILAELHLALATLLAGGRYLSPKIQERLIHIALDKPDAPSGLTPRQTEILRLIALGLTGKEIARELDISPKTVEFHRAQLMGKIGVHDVAGLTRHAMQIGLVA